MFGQETSQNQQTVGPCTFFQRGKCKLSDRCGSEDVINGKYIEQSIGKEAKKRRLAIQHLMLLNEASPKRIRIKQSIGNEAKRRRLEISNLTLLNEACKKRTKQSIGNDVKRMKLEVQLEMPKSHDSDRSEMEDLEADILLSIVQRDLMAMALSEMWPLSSYGPLKYASSLVDFEEYSTEEVRHAFYEAKAYQKDVDDYLIWVAMLGCKNMQAINRIIGNRGEQMNGVLANVKGLLSEIKGFSSQPVNLSTIIDDEEDILMTEAE